MKKDRILVFPCGSEIGLEIYRSFVGEKAVELYGGSSVGDHGKYVYKNYIPNIPFVNSPEFIGSLNDIIKKHSIAYLYPAHDDVSLVFSKNESKLACPVIGSSYKTSRICRSKSMTYEYFENSIRVPVTHTSKTIAKESFPLYLKPDMGQGSKGNYLAHNQADLSFYSKKDKSLIALEYLPGDEYTIDCFTDNSRKLLFSGARKRARILNGISVNTHRVACGEFEPIARKINDSLSFCGAWFFQMKRTKDGDLCLLEIAPRISGSMALYRNLGVNFAVLSYLAKKNIECSIVFNDYVIEMDRALDNKYHIDISYYHVYLDLDDCLIVDSKINLKLIRFIYQCINNNIQVNLLTRHEGSVATLLEKHRLDNTFDNIIQISAEELKSAYIKESRSIFIDDSFSERKDVKSKLGIPVFSLDAIESLIN